MSNWEKPQHWTYADPSESTRERQMMLDRSAYVTLEGPVHIDFNIGVVLDYIAMTTSTLPREYQYRNAGQHRFVVVFPSGYVRNKFVTDEMKAKVNGFWVCFKAWKISNSSMPFVYKKNVWIRVYGLAEHHYTFDKVERLVQNFGRLVDIDEGKTDLDLSVLDALIDCPDVDEIPPGGDYLYDYYYGTKVTFAVDLEMDFKQFISLGLDNPSYSFVKVYRRAFDAFRAGLLETFSQGSRGRTG